MDCGVCLESFNSSDRQPVILECGHTICKECIEDIIAHQPICPFDRKGITKPIKDLSMNYSLMEMIEKFNKVLKISKQNVPASSAFPEESKESQPEESKEIKEAEYHAVLYSTPVVCRNNHTLRYTSNTSELYIKQYGFNQLMCDFCNSTWKGGSWHCSACSFDICTVCYEEESRPRAIGFDTQHKCRNHHQMYHYLDLSSFKVKRSRNAASEVITCAVCAKEWTGASYACKLCDYELCENCITVTPKLTCDRKHELILRSDVVSYYAGLGYNCWNCDICKRKYNTASWHCRECRFDECQECYRYYSKNKPINIPEAKCTNGHALIKSADNITYYRSISDSALYNCNGCGRSNSNIPNQCRRCCFDLCDNCVNVIKDGVSKGIRSKCQNNHSLTWHYDTVNFYKTSMCCDYCRKCYSKVGSFHCRACKTDMCLSCAGLNINP